MHHVSQNFKEVVACAGREWHYKAEITLKDGTRYNLGEQDIVQNGIQFSSMSTSSHKFKIGCISADQLTLGLNNYDGRYDGVDFEGSTIAVYVGLVVEQNWEKGNLVEWVRLGTFYGEEATKQGLALKISAFDGTFAFDKAYSESSLKYPATLGQILQDACNCCGVVLATPDFPNSDYIVDERPDEDSLNFRTVLEYLVPLTGSFMSFDEYGKLILKWYDTKSEPCAQLHNPTEMWSNDVTITGIEYYEPAIGKTVIFGSEGYTVDISSNRLVQNNVDEILNGLRDRVIGFRFCPYNTEMPSNPALQTGDPVAVYDSQGNARRSYVMLMEYRIGSPMGVKAVSESVSQNSKYRPAMDRYTLERAGTNADKQINLYDTYAKQFAAMASASVGYYTTEVTQDDGSVILYSHDKPELSESMNIWKKTGLVVAVSNDGGKTWRGLDKDGNAILNDVAAKTIVADKIKTGRLEGYDGKSYWDFDTGEMLVSGKFQQYDAKGYKSVDIIGNRLNVYNWDTNGDYVGSIGAVETRSTGQKNIAIYADSDAYLSLGTKSSDGDGINSYIRIHDDQTNPILLYGHVNGNGATIRNVQIKDCPQLIPFGNVTSLNLVNGSDGVYLEIGNGNQSFRVKVS